LASTAVIVIRLIGSPHRPQSCQDFSLRGKPRVNRVLGIIERVLEEAFERVISFRSSGGFKDFTGNVFERTATRRIEMRMR
jgi:hypothetical protein